MKDFLFSLLKDQPAALLTAVLVVWWVEPNTTGGMIFTIILVMAFISALLQIARLVWNLLRPRTAAAPPTKPAD